MSLSDSDRVWNRAALALGEEEGLEDGDRALRALLLADSLFNNNGVLNVVVEELSRQELDAAIVGYRFFGMDEVAEFVLEAAEIDLESLSESEGDMAEADLDTRYWELAGNDEIMRRFETMYNTERGNFAPP